MNHQVKSILLGSLIAAILAGCQSSSAATPPGFNSPGGRPMGTPNPDMMTQIASNPEMQTRIASSGTGGMGLPAGQAAQVASATPSPVPTETSEPTATSTPETYAAEQAARAYFDAVSAGDFAAAAEQISSFSKTISDMTTNDIVTVLTEQKSSGWVWSHLEILGSQMLDQKTVLVHVTLTASVPDASTGTAVVTSLDELWPFRLEMTGWRYNWENIIDYSSLSADPQKSGGLTVKPMQMIRYSDKIRLAMLVQNNTDGAIVIGLPNQVLATFHFGGESVNAVQTRYFFDAYRSYPDIHIDVMGFYEEYPDSVEMVKFTNTVAPPWFTFGLVD